MECLKDITEESDNIMVRGDINCKEVKLGNESAEGREDSCKSRLLNRAMENIMVE